MYTVRQLSEMLDKYPGDAEVMISRGGGQEILSVFGVRSGAKHKDVAPIERESRSFITFSSHPEPVCIILA